MKKLTLTALFSMALAFAAPASRTFTGVITDSMCNLDHSHMGAPDPAKCVLDCVRSSPKYKFVLHDGKTAYKLSDQETPARFAAKKVKVTGILYEKTGVIQVQKIEEAK